MSVSHEYCVDNCILCILIFFQILELLFYKIRDLGLIFSSIVTLFSSVH